MPRIMIVDDEEDLRDVINVVLRKVGYETLTAENGDDLFTKIDGFHPDLITLDIMMPGLPIPDILTRLRDAYGNPPVILVTVVRYTKEDQQSNFAHGNVVDYITKPFDVTTLIRTISMHAPQGQEQPMAHSITAAA